MDTDPLYFDFFFAYFLCIQIVLPKMKKRILFHFVFVTCNFEWLEGLAPSRHGLFHPHIMKDRMKEEQSEQSHQHTFSHYETTNSKHE